MVSSEDVKSDSASERKLIAFLHSFEQQWHVNRTSAENYLATTEWVEKEGVLGELLHSELELRQRFGPTPSEAEFAERLPDHEQLVRQAFAQLKVAQSGIPQAERILGDYRLVRELGRGGMGVVFEAEQVSLQRNVALKVLPNTHLSSDYQRRQFQREAQAAAKLHHTNIVPIHDVAEHDGILFYTMTLIRGGTLAQHFSGVSESSEVSPVEVAKIGAQLADALDYAHQNGVLHRDVKPSNVLMDEQGQPWISDFGLSKLTDSSTTQNSIAGTLRFMAPEVFDGQADPRSDVYALGLTLYEVLAKRPAVEGEDWQILQHIHRGQIKPLAQVRPDVPRDLATVVGKAAEAVAQRRYRSAGELRDDLQRFLHDEPIRARVATRWELFFRWCRKHKMLAWLSFASALLLVLAVSASITAAVVFYRSDLRQRKLAESNHRLAQDNALQRSNAQAELVKSRRVLADLYRENGFRAEQSNQLPMAALWFSEAARTAEGFDEHKVRFNAIRARNALRVTPRRRITFQSGHTIDRLNVHPDGRWLISTDQHATGKDYLWSTSDGQRHRFQESLGKVTALTWNQEGTLLAAGTETGQVHLFNYPNFDSPVLSSMVSADQPYMIRELEFSPDGKQLAAIRSKHIVLFSPGDLSHMTLDQYHPNHIRTLGFSPDSQWLYSVSGSALCRVFSMKTKEVILTTPHFTGGNGWKICRPVFDDQKRIVTWDQGLVWTTLADGMQERTPFESEAFQLTWIPPTKQIFVTCNGLLDGYLCRPGKPPKACGQGNRLAALYSKSRNEILAGGSYRQFTIYDVNAKKSKLSSVQQPTMFRALEMTPDGQQLVTADYDSTIHVWKYPEKHAFYKTISAGSLPPKVEVNPNGQHILIRRTHKNAQVYELKTCLPVSPELIPEGQLIEASWLPKPGLIVTLAKANSKPQALIDVWEWKTGKRVRATVIVDVAPADSAGNSETRLAIQPDGKRLAYVSLDDRCVTVSLDERMSNESGASRKIDTVRCSSLLSSPSGNFFLAITETAPLQVTRVAWDDSQSSKSLERADILSIQWVDGSLLGVSGATGAFQVDPDTFETVDLPLPSGEVLAKTFSGNRRQIAFVARDGYTRTWDHASATLLHPPIDHAGDKVALTPNGKVLVIPHRTHPCRLIDTNSGTRICPEFSLDQTPLWTYSGGRNVSITHDSRFVVIGGTPHIVVMDLQYLIDDAATDPLEALISECETVSGKRIESGRPVVLPGR